MPASKNNTQARVCDYQNDAQSTLVCTMSFCEIQIHEYSTIASKTVNNIWLKTILAICLLVLTKSYSFYIPIFVLFFKTHLVALSQSSKPAGSLCSGAKRYPTLTIITSH